MASYRIYVCHNRDCRERGAAQVWAGLQREIVLRGLENDVELIVAGCQSRCEWGPNVTVHPGATKYSGVDRAATRAIIEQHIVGGTPASDYLFGAS
ncbi:MAG: (2Fe-2S) ferredoxin domain-containing protein [Herpetosiphonaceae bacterium]|nr:(2Fe-2S) ferredoxin domain-containing protein [Herpetosiphonaceae bacterium]